MSAQQHGILEKVLVCAQTLAAQSLLLQAAYKVQKLATTAVTLDSSSLGFLSILRQKTIILANVQPIKMLALTLQAIYAECTHDSTCNLTIQKCVQGFCRCNYPLVFGEQCNVQVDECNAYMCSGNGNCNYQTSQCQCSENFSPSTACASCETDFVYVERYCYPQGCVDPQNLTALCSANGKCAEGGKCECVSGYIGRYCAILYSACDAKCGYNQRCDAEERCYCKEHFAAPDCFGCEEGYILLTEMCIAKDAVSEDSKICSERGAYYEGKCICNASFYGSSCYLTQAQCDQEFCGGLGQCATVNGSLDCACDDNRAGAYCSDCSKDYRKLANGSCIIEPCWHNGAECAGFGTCAGSRCYCATGRLGARCESDFTMCAQERCGGVGKCVVDGQNAFFECQCLESRAGANCENCATEYIFKGVCWERTLFGIAAGVCGGVVLVLVVVITVFCCCRKRFIVRSVMKKSVGVGRSGASRTYQNMSAAIW